MNRQIFRKLGAKIIILVLIVSAFVIEISIVNSPKKQPQSAVPIPTPIPLNKPVTFPSKTYTNDSSDYLFQYPQSWVDAKTIEGNDGADTLIYNESGQDYKFQVVTTGNFGLQGYGAQIDKTQKQMVSYNNVVYTKIIYYQNNTPFYVAAVPVDDSIPYKFQMYLPPTNNEKYLDWFDQMLTTFRINH